MSNNNILIVKSLNYIIDKKIIINDFNFQVKYRDFISIVGPNGSGKSTLLKLLSNDILPSSGEILLLNKRNIDWNSMELAGFRSVLPQINDISFPFTAFDIAKMGRYPINNGVGNFKDNDIINKLFEIFDLQKISKQTYSSLSGGEKQRVQLVRVFAQIWSNDSYFGKLLLLDEPTSFLDVKYQLILFDFLKSLHLKGLTIIMVIHDLNQAALYSNKIMFLKDSCMVKYGKTEKMIDNNLLFEVFDVNFNINFLKEKYIRR